jgi:hypothetical protein
VPLGVGVVREEVQMQGKKSRSSSIRNSREWGLLCDGHYGVHSNRTCQPQSFLGAACR